ncbi:filament-like plant protein 7 isoform X2 [Macadamia integrifolia]|uniref:filament-like plant protein 7 isoform X2 n=1 Tax=Macadamia integrifolia TaxID=60698 RepID=UPI001C4F03F0|nr:filament-like plant protein 7 isoform X2 [Macadamia integrifolia]
MDQKAWLWRKKSTEKTIVVSDKANLLLKGNGEEKLGTEKAEEMEISVKTLNEKLSLATSECNAKDDLVMKHAKVAEEAIAGWEKAETESLSLKQELDEALQQRAAAEERLAHVDAALKECMQQLRFVRDEQEQRIHDAVLKVSRQFEKARIVLEEKLAEVSMKLSKLGIENTHLSKDLQVKEKLIEDLSRGKSQAEANFKTLMVRLDSMEKEDASLKYEVHMLEKELEIRNEEKDFNRRSADASHKQHLENVKKIARLEAECQRLRLLVRKRLPGPAALAKMKNEVEMLEKDLVDMSRRKLNSSMTGLMVKDFGADNSPDTPIRRINFLTEKLCAMEEENRALKESLSKKNNELQSSRMMCSHTASTLSQVEAQLGVLSKEQTSMALTRSFSSSHELSLDSISTFGNEDEPSSARSWASALISEPEHFRNGRPRRRSPCSTVAIPEISLMDDFVEMEKLAIVSVDKPFGSSHSSGESYSFMGPLKAETGVNPSNATGKEIVPVTDSHSGSGHMNQKIQSKDQSIGKSPSWIQEILRMILEQNRITQKNPEEILEEIRTVLMHMNPGEFVNAKEVSRHSEASEPTRISGYISWRPPNTSPKGDSFDGASEINIQSKELNKQLQSNLSKSICKIIELIEGINQPSLMDYHSPQIMTVANGTPLLDKNPATPTGYLVRVFQWKSSELNAVLQKFVQSCNEILSGKADLEKFSRELTSALEWIVNHCFSLQDVSSMRDMIKKHFDWDESRSESEVEMGMNSLLPEGDKVRASRERLSCFPSTAAPTVQSNSFQMEEFKSTLGEENGRLRDELKNVQSAKKDLEGRLQSATQKSESLIVQLQESEQHRETLHTELEKLKESKGIIEDQIENHKLLNEDLDTQLTVARVELNGTRQKFSSLEAELEDKSNFCEELEATCLELQLQLESVTKEEIPKHNPNQEQKQLRTDWEITAASEKLAECQETILNLGKQLKALSSPREAILFDKVISTSDTPANNKTKNTTHRSSLLDQMLAEDDAEGDDLKSPKTKEIICSVEPPKVLSLPSNDSNSLYGPIVPVETVETSSSNEIKHKETTSADALAIVPVNKRGGGVGLLKKLLSRRKRGNRKKASLPIAT